MGPVGPNGHAWWYCDLIAVVIGAGLAIDELVEVGEPTPDVLAVRAHRG